MCNAANNEGTICSNVTVMKEQWERDSNEGAISCVVGHG